MSLRRQNVARPAPGPDDEDEFSRVSESLASALAKAGITGSALESGLEEARSHVFARHYPELARQLGIQPEPPDR
jgi:hypothetical protein